MDPLVKPSFIPKTPLIDTSRQTTKKSAGVFSVLIIVMILGTVFSYLYVQMQTKKIVAIKNQHTLRMEKARKEIGVDFVSDMVALQKKITAAQQLLENHVAVSPIFAAIQKTTVQKVQYTDFAYSLEGGSDTAPKMVVVKMNGVAPDYKTIALQTDALSQNTFIKEPIISDIKNNELSKNLSFMLEFKVDPKDVTYEKVIGATETPAGELSYE